MATYKEITELVKNRHHISVKSCWIAHVKELNGLPLRRAPNRISKKERKHPCPDRHRPKIESAMKHFGMLKQDK